MQGQRPWNRQNTRRALIVGAGEGLSASLARLFNRQGIRVALGRAENREARRALPPRTGARAFGCDATDADERRAACSAWSSARIATPDVVVYNAAGGRAARSSSWRPDDVAQADRPSAPSAASWWRSRP